MYIFVFICLSQNLRSNPRKISFNSRAREVGRFLNLLFYSDGISSAKYCLKKTVSALNLHIHLFNGSACNQPWTAVAIQG